MHKQTAISNIITFLIINFREILIIFFSHFEFVNYYYHV